MDCGFRGGATRSISPNNRPLLLDRFEENLIRRIFRNESAFWKISPIFERSNQNLIYLNGPGGIQISRVVLFFKPVKLNYEVNFSFLDQNDQKSKSFDFSQINDIS